MAKRAIYETKKRKKKGNLIRKIKEGGQKSSYVNKRYKNAIRNENWAKRARHEKNDDRNENTNCNVKGAIGREEETGQQKPGHKKKKENLRENGASHKEARLPKYYEKIKTGTKEAGLLRTYEEMEPATKLARLPKYCEDIKPCTKAGKLPRIIT